MVLLTNVDHLTKDAQHALRRTMEKYVATCRLILCTNSTSRVLPAIKSRCLAIRVPAPTMDEVKEILGFVARKEGLSLPDELATRIAEMSGRNLRRAIFMLERCKVEQYPVTLEQSVMEPDWQIFIKAIAKLMINEQNPKKLLEIRNRFYDLLTHAIPTDLIFKVTADLEEVRSAAEDRDREHRGEVQAQDAQWHKDDFSPAGVHREIMPI